MLTPPSPPPQKRAPPHTNITAAARAAADTVEAKRAAGCKTALDLIASQNPQLPMHIVHQEILNSPSLKGTLFVPTAEAWDKFFATVRQRQGNPEAPAMVSRYGQVMLYHLAQDINVPIAVPTPGVSRFAFDTASTLQCSVGPNLPNNRITVRKTPEAIYLQHGTGNATLVSQPIPYCGGEAYLVDQVLIPCSDVAAIMGEIANVPSPCKNNVEGVLQRNGLSYYNALLLATGVNRPIFAAVRNFTLFAPTDAAIQAAYADGAFDYPEMFAKRKKELAGLLAYHAVPQVAHTAPSAATARMDTLLSQGVGNASCPSPSLSWRPDGFVYGGTGAAKVGGTYDRGCAAVIFQVDSILGPCCRKMGEILRDMKQEEGSVSAQVLAALKAKAKDAGGARSTLIMPTDEAWQALLQEAAAANRSLGADAIAALTDYLYTGADVASVIETATPVKTALSLADAKSRAALCPRGTNGTLIFAYDDAPEEAVTAAEGVSEAPTTGVVAGPAAADVAPAAAAPSDVPTLTAGAPSALPAAAAPAAPAAAAPAAVAAPAGPALPGAVAAGPAAAGARRRLLAAAAKLPTTASGTLLPTAFGAAAGGGAGAAGGPAKIISGPVMIVDGATTELGSARGVPVASITYACDGTIYHVNAVPLPCNFLGRKAVVRPVAPKPKAPLPTTLSIQGALVNTTAIPNAVANVTSAATTAVAAAAPLIGSGAAAVVLAAMLL